MRITEKTVRQSIQEAIEDNHLGEDPLAYVGGDLGHGARYIFTDGHVALGAREALAYVDRLCRLAHGL